MIKLLACLFMLIDHVGLMFFPRYYVLRMIGRLSMPLYAYCIARGAKYTHDINKYAVRVLKVAVIAQIPYMLMVKELKLNICFLWLIGLLIIKYYKEPVKKQLKALATCGAVTLCAIIPVDYRAYGLVYMLITYFFMVHNNIDKKMYASWGALHIVKVLINVQSGILQVFTLPTIPLIEMCNRYGLEEKRVKSIWIEYFYPIHISLLLLTLYVYNAIM